MTSSSDFTHELLGLSNATYVLMENQEDLESCMELALRYDDLNHSKVTRWRELADFALFAFEYFQRWLAIPIKANRSGSFGTTKTNKR